MVVGGGKNTSAIDSTPTLFPTLSSVFFKPSWALYVLYNINIHTHTLTHTHTYSHINSQWNVERHTRKFQSANEWWGWRGRCDRDTVGVRVDARGKGQKLSIQPAQIIMIITIRWRLGVRMLGLYRRWRGQRGWYRRRRWQRRVSGVVHI